MARKAQYSFQVALETSLAFIGVLFLLKATEALLHISFRHFGILPRTLIGLPGIFFSPLLHSSMGHLAANSVPLLVLLTILLSTREYHPYRTLALVWGLSGLGTWLIGRGEAFHIGASSVVFGLAAFLIVAGFMLKSWKSAGITIFVLVFYGGIFYGALPQNGPISWEGHLCGAIAGAWTARRTLA